MINHSEYFIRNGLFLNGIIAQLGVDVSEIVWSATADINEMSDQMLTTEKMVAKLQVAL